MVMEEAKFKVGVIGNGFVGEAQAFAFAPTTNLRIYDLDPLRSSHSLEEILEVQMTSYFLLNIFYYVMKTLKTLNNICLSFLMELFKKI